MTRSLWILLVSFLTLLGSVLWYVVLVIWLQAIVLGSWIRVQISGSPGQEPVRRRTSGEE